MNQKNLKKHAPWNKGKLIGQKSPLKLKEIWAIRIRLQMAKNTRELALFNLAIDSKLRGCDLVKLKVCDVAQGGRVLSRTMIMQQKTHRPVQFEITEQTRDSLAKAVIPTIPHSPSFPGYSKHQHGSSAWSIRLAEIIQGNIPIAFFCSSH